MHIFFPCNGVWKHQSINFSWKQASQYTPFANTLQFETSLLKLSFCSIPLPDASGSSIFGSMDITHFCCFSVLQSVTEMWTHWCYWMPNFVAWKEELCKTSQIQERKDLPWSCWSSPWLWSCLLGSPALQCCCPARPVTAAAARAELSPCGPSCPCSKQRIPSETGSVTQVKGGRLPRQVARASCSFPWCVCPQGTWLSPAHNSRVPYRQCRFLEPLETPSVDGGGSAQTGNALCSPGAFATCWATEPALERGAGRRVDARCRLGPLHNSLLPNTHGLRWSLTLICSQAGARNKCLSLLFVTQKQSSHLGEGVCTCVGRTNGMRGIAPLQGQSELPPSPLWFYTLQSKIHLTQRAWPSYKVQTCFLHLLPKVLSSFTLINVAVCTVDR